MLYFISFLLGTLIAVVETQSNQYGAAIKGILVVLLGINEFYRWQRDEKEKSERKKEIDDAHKKLEDTTDESRRLANELKEFVTGGLTELIAGGENMPSILFELQTSKTSPALAQYLDIYIENRGIRPLHDVSVSFSDELADTIKNEVRHEENPKLITTMVPGSKERFYSVKSSSVEKMDPKTEFYYTFIISYNNRSYRAILKFTVKNRLLVPESWQVSYFQDGGRIADPTKFMEIRFEHEPGRLKF